MCDGTLKCGLGSRNALKDLEMRSKATKGGLETWDLETWQRTCVFYTGEDQKLQSPLQHLQKARAWQSQTHYNPTLPDPFLQTPPLNQKGSGRQTLFAKARVAAGPWYTSHL